MCNILWGTKTMRIEAVYFIYFFILIENGVCVCINMGFNNHFLIIEPKQAYRDRPRPASLRVSLSALDRTIKDGLAPYFCLSRTEKGQTQCHDKKRAVLTDIYFHLVPPCYKQLSKGGEFMISMSTELNHYLDNYDKKGTFYTLSILLQS